MSDRPSKEDAALQIRRVIEDNKRMIRLLSLQNQALVSLLPRRVKPRTVKVFNPFEGRMEDIEKKKPRRRT